MFLYFDFKESHRYFKIFLHRRYWLYWHPQLKILTYASYTRVEHLRPLHKTPASITLCTATNNYILSCVIQWSIFSTQGPQKLHCVSFCPGAASYYRGTGKYPGIWRKIPGYFSVPRFYDVTLPGYWQIPGYLTACQIPGYMTANDSRNNVRFVQAYLRCVKLYRFQFIE